MKKAIVCIALLALLALGGPAFAELCAIDAVPAATLLLPYFEVEPDTDTGLTTLFSINNASAAPTIAHVTLWTDESIPTLDFDVFLTGYDVQTINIRDIFRGILPVTADLQHDGKDMISPHGANLPWDGNFNGCDAFPYVNPVLDVVLLQHIRAAHTGGESDLYEGCLAARYGDGHYRGYITVDNATQCSVEFPSAPGYFTPGPARIASNVNQLWGDYFYVDEVNNFAQGEALVHIEADDLFDAGSTPTGYTFYGRYPNAAGGIDNREPLGTTWASRYLLAGAFDGGTDLVVWRDSLRADSPNAHACNNYFGWVPLPQTQVVAFSEEEDATLLCRRVGPPISPPRVGERDCFPWETGRYPVGAFTNVPLAEPLNTPYPFGWIYLNLNYTFLQSPFVQPIVQSHVSVLMSALGRFSVGFDAIELTSACETDNPVIVGIGI